MSELLTHPSPNWKQRTTRPRVLVLHADAGATDKATLDWCSKDAAAMKALWEATPAKKRPEKPWGAVSYHDLIGRQGTRYTLVDPARVAFHAGDSEWGGIKWINGISIGLAFANRHDTIEPLTPAQIAMMLGVVEGYARSQPSLEALTTHYKVSPGRKRDPLDCPGFELAMYEEAFARGVASR
jgi:N-acetylmuramoyl-L-alanine amidase